MKIIETYRGFILFYLEGKKLKKDRGLIGIQVDYDLIWIYLLFLTFKIKR